MTTIAITGRDVCESAGAQRLNRRLIALFRKWQTNRRTRKDLARLSDFMLKDLGISRSQAENEYQKPFWKQ
ncbi:DUF1127 domain-containing protein [Marinobacter alexandrii]|uniref:DUF1127 domain-containing protein n=1 Tax=Marinobacter alexandrii TaxID=2570351 RepID=UPI0011092E0F|nr:DUF1127 domain-containing protein [Marinobacter alexandrii]